MQTTTVFIYICTDITVHSHAQTVPPPETEFGRITYRCQSMNFTQRRRGHKATRWTPHLYTRHSSQSHKFSHVHAKNMPPIQIARLQRKCIRARRRRVHCFSLHTNRGGIYGAVVCNELSWSKIAYTSQ